MNGDDSDITEDELAAADGVWDSLEEGTVGMAKWTAEKRETPAGDKAGPHNSFPVETQEDLDNAARLIGHATDPEAVKAKLIRIAKRKGLTIPKAWQEKATMSDSVGFDMGSGELEGDEVVYHDALIFRTGNYPDKDFSLTPEEAEAAVDNFEPVLNEYEHMKSRFGNGGILDGQFGEVRDVWLSDDGTEIRASVAIPEWLDSRWKGKKSVSAVWDRATKTISGLGLVIKGRVPDAALMAAFAVSHPDELKAIFDDGGYETPHGNRLIQMMHDCAARGGAMCSAATFRACCLTSSKEREGLDAIHNMCVSYGAKCSPGRTARMSQPEEGFMSSLVTKFKALFGASLPAETPDDNIKEFFSELKNFSADPVEEEDEDGEEEETPPPKKKTKMKPKEAAMSAAVETFADSALARQMREEIDALKTQNLMNQITSAATTFADAEIKACRALPSEKAALVALFAQAALDDNRSAAKVTFSDDKGQPKVGSRTDALKALYAARPVHALFSEYVSTGNLPVGSQVLLNQDDPAKKDTKEVGFSSEKDLDEALLSYGPMGERAIRLRKNGTL